MRFAMTFSALLLGAGMAQAQMSLSFEWGDIPACNSGKPNVVGSPRFVIRGVPAGTTSVEFRLKDLDVPGKGSCIFIHQWRRLSWLCG